MAVSNSTTLRKTPRRMRFSVMSRNSLSTMFNHEEPFSPASDCVVTHPKLVGGGPDPGSLREQQEDPGSFHDPGRNRLAPGPAFKLSAVLSSDFRGRLRPNMTA